MLANLNTNMKVIVGISSVVIIGIIYAFIKNIFKEPIEEKFPAYVINYKLKKIEEKYELITNYSNFIEISKNLIHKDNFFFTKKFMGVPIYISIKLRNRISNLVYSTNY